MSYKDFAFEMSAYTNGMYITLEKYIEECYLASAYRVIEDLYNTRIIILDEEYRIEVGVTQEKEIKYIYLPNGMTLTAFSEIKGLLNIILRSTNNIVYSRRWGNYQIDSIPYGLNKNELRECIHHAGKTYLCDLKGLTYQLV